MYAWCEPLSTLITLQLYWIYLQICIHFIFFMVFLNRDSQYVLLKMTSTRKLGTARTWANIYCHFKSLYCRYCVQKYIQLFSFCHLHPIQQPKSIIYWFDGHSCVMTFTDTGLSINDSAIYVHLDGPATVSVGELLFWHLTTADIAHSFLSKLYYVRDEISHKELNIFSQANLQNHALHKPAEIDLQTVKVKNKCYSKNMLIGCNLAYCKWWKINLYLMGFIRGIHFIYVGLILL